MINLLSKNLEGGNYNAKYEYRRGSDYCGRLSGSFRGG